MNYSKQNILLHRLTSHLISSVLLVASLFAHVWNTWSLDKDSWPFLPHLISISVKPVEWESAVLKSWPVWMAGYRLCSALTSVGSCGFSRLDFRICTKVLTEFMILEVLPILKMLLAFSCTFITFSLFPFLFDPMALFLVCYNNLSCPCSLSSCQSIQYRGVNASKTQILSCHKVYIIFVEVDKHSAHVDSNSKLP